jgi:hypothetical protein
MLALSWAMSLIIISVIIDVVALRRHGGAWTRINRSRRVRGPEWEQLEPYERVTFYAMPVVATLGGSVTVLVLSMLVGDH